MKQKIKTLSNKNLIFRILFRYASIIRSKRVTEGKTKLNILKTFPMYEAHGWGLYAIRAKLTIQSINQTIPALANFVEFSKKNEDFADVLKNSLLSEDIPEDIRLGELFRKYGSDKSTTHNYYKVYSFILREMREPRKIFEIGLGTNNVDVVSTMGTEGKPGASLRAFRDFCPEAQLIGADFDSRILFSEDRIETYFVDQTKPKTFENLRENIGSNYDLMIDDGLHAPNANLHSLYFFLQNLNVGGYAVIEDIDFSTKPIWDIISQLINQSYSSALIETKNSCMFIVRRDS